MEITFQMKANIIDVYTFVTHLHCVAACCEWRTFTPSNFQKFSIGFSLRHVNIVHAALFFRASIRSPDIYGRSVVQKM